MRGRGSERGKGEEAEMRRVREQGVREEGLEIREKG